MMEFKRIKEVFPTWKTDGAIFAELATRAVPWAASFSAIAVGLDYYGNFSGNKIISSLVENILPSDGALTSAEITILTDIIMGLYATKWGKLWATMLLEYNPLENYNMVETMIDDETVTEYGKTNTRTDNLERQRTDNLSSQRTDNLQHQRTDNLSSQRTDNLTHEKDGTETETPNTTTQDDNSVYGFNSVDAVPSDSRTIENTGTNQKEYDLTERDTGTQTQLNTGTQTEADTGTQTQLNTGTQTEADTGTQTSEDSGSDTSTRNYRLTRSGNIGVTTSQQMLESERELWRVWNFFRGIVYPDIDRVLTIEIY